MIKQSLFLLLVVYSTVSTATLVVDCDSGRAYADREQVKVSGCDGPPCALKRKTTVNVEQRFIPKHDVKTLTTSVHAQILGLPVPFIGVDGADACSRIFHTDGTQASCPLTRGTEYVYKNSFPIHNVYPRINTKVHWALTEGSNNVACFEVASKITS